MTAAPGSFALNQLLREAERALGSGRPDDAERLLGQAVGLAPDNAEIHRLMGIASLMGGAHAKAIEHLQNALAKRPEDATIHMTLGSALVEIGANEDGLLHLGRACELAPDNAEAWCNFGVALKYTGHMEQARDAFERALAIHPVHIKARKKLVEVMVSLGDTASAVRMLRDTLSMQPDNVDAWVALGNVKTEILGSEDVRQIRDLLHRPGMTDNARIALGFTLAKGLEDQSEYTAAFDTVSEANALMRKHLYWSRDEERGRVDAIAQAFSHSMSEAVDPSLGSEVIFVVHLPRSGSTLVEQILASHSQVRGGDELDVLPGILDEESERRGQPFPQWATAATSEDWQRLGESYLERTRYLREQHPRFTDKTPNNWAFVGAALAMLPGARVVNVRRDPLETCLACYRQLFLVGFHFTYDLDDLVGYYAGYERLRALWRHRFPRRYLDYSYELLQQEAESRIRQLLDFCKLPFEAACLDFHKTRRTVLTFSASQVREPLRRNTARSALFGTRLDPLRAKLRAVHKELNLEVHGPGP